MTIFPAPLLTLSACLASALALEACAGENLAAFYPEGPLVVGETTLFAEMHRDRIVAWSADGRQPFYKSKGCGPTAIAPYAEGYAVLCHMRDEIHVISGDGRPLTVLHSDSQGKSFVNPNDASADGLGGVYFSASGVFDPSEQPKGALLYLDPSGDIHRLADKLNYANGVHFDQTTRRLYLSEHLRGLILTYPEIAPGHLGRPAVFKNFASEKIAPIDGFRLTGPDGLETDAEGNLYVAYYGAGLLFILSPDGAVLHRIIGLEPLITNVTLADGSRRLIVTGSQLSRRRPYSGSVRAIANPLTDPHAP